MRHRRRRGDQSTQQVVVAKIADTVHKSRAIAIHHSQQSDALVNLRFREQSRPSRFATASFTSASVRLPTAGRLSSIDRAADGESIKFFSSRKRCSARRSVICAIGPAAANEDGDMFDTCVTMSTLSECALPKGCRSSRIHAKSETRRHTLKISYGDSQQLASTST